MISSKLPQFILRYILVGSSHAFSLVIPVLLIPLLIKRIGADAVGAVILVQTISSFFLVFTEYDFNIWGARRIANDKTSQNELSQVVTSKIILVVLSMPLLVIGARLYFKNDLGWFLGLGGVCILFGYAISLNWYYQAKEAFGVLSFLNFGSKLLYVAGVYLFVQTMDDAWLVNIFFGLGFLLVNASFLLGKLKFRFEIPDLRRGIDYFISNGLLQIFTNTAVLWISIFLLVESITIFASAERLVFVARGALAVYATIIFPGLCRSHKGKLETTTKKIHVVVCVIFLLLSLFVYAYASSLSSWMLRAVSVQGVEILRILSPVPFLISLNVLSNQWLIAQGRFKIIRNIYAAVAFLSITLLPLGTYFFGLYGAAYVTVILEFAISFGLIWAHIRELRIMRSVGEAK